MTIELPEDVEIEVSTSGTSKQSKVNTQVEELTYSAGKMTLTVEEVSELLNISKSLVYTMARENQIPHKKVGARVLFHRHTIEK